MLKKWYHFYHRISDLTSFTTSPHITWQTTPHASVLSPRRLLEPLPQAQPDSLNKYLSTCFIPSPVLGYGDLKDTGHLSLLPGMEDRC